MNRKEYMKLWIENNREHIRAYDRKRYAENNTKKLKLAKHYYALNRDSVKQKTSIYQKEIAKPRKLSALEKIAGRVKPSTCEICGAANKIFFDHCHVTGKFRGWLCMNCNLALGHCRDNVSLLYKLIAYLNSSRAGPLTLEKSPISNLSVPI